MNRSLRRRAVIVSSLLSAVLLFASLGQLVPAHAATAQTFTVTVGSETSYGGTVMAFEPKLLKVHRGDTVTFNFQGFHNVRFANSSEPLAVKSTIDGKSVGELNPDVAFPNAQSGDKFKTGLSTGLPTQEPTFSVVMDAATGTYTYVCDIHPGMIGYIEVVADSETVPSPDEIAKTSQADLAAQVAQIDKLYMDTLKSSSDAAQQPSPNGATIQAGVNSGTVAINHFFPEAAQVTVGQTVTWKMPAFAEPHTVNFPIPSTIGDPIQFTMDAKQQPHLLLGDALVKNVDSGVEFPANGVADSGILTGNQTFALKFNKPGVYVYYCGIHPNMIGVVDVLPPQEPQPTAAATQAAQ